MTCSTAATSKSKLTVAQGGKLNVLITVRDVDGELVDLTGASVWFTVRHRTLDTAHVILKRSTLAGGDSSQIEILDQIATPGQLRIKLLATDTKNLQFTPTYVYDVFVTLAGDDGPYQVIPRSEFDILPSVTRI
jgi:hypothetical protein